MKYPTRRKPPQWRRVRGRRIHGVLFEIDTHRAALRFKRGRRVETVCLREFGLVPTIDTVKEKCYNENDGNKIRARKKDDSQ